MRFHVLGLPHTVSNLEYLACAYTQKVVKFCQMMQGRGHTLFHYGHEESDVPCDEHITVVTNADLEKAYGNYNWRENFFQFDVNDYAYQTYYKNTIAEIEKRKEKYDFVLAFFGWGHKAVCDAFPDLINVEPGIGYSYGVFAPYKIYESYCIMHIMGGTEASSHCKTDWYASVIPNYFDTSQFTFRDKDEKEDYFLYLGRVYEGKGVHIAIQAAEAAGVKLKVAGQGGIVQEMSHMGYTKLPDHVEELGYAGVEMRRELMSKAKAAFIPSIYHEPFGGVQIEMLLSGTPTITPDWGAFTENNLHGLTGYRCRTFGDFVEAAKNIDKIDPKFCREWAERNFDMHRVVEMYEKTFTDILNVEKGDKGWYNSYSNLSSLEKYYPNIN
jgi:glycosyltransferase involved in cell wall biosynthesis